MGTKPRRKFTAQFKLDAVLERGAGHKSVAQICRERAITEQLLYDWKRAFTERAPMMFDTSATALSETQARIAELERLVGRLTLENEILKKAGTNWTLVSSRNGR
jgi:transposase-like protein